MNPVENPVKCDFSYIGSMHVRLKPGEKIRVLYACNSNSDISDGSVYTISSTCPCRFYPPNKNFIGCDKACGSMGYEIKVTEVSMMLCTSIIEGLTTEEKARKSCKWNNFDFDKLIIKNGIVVGRTDL